MRGGVRGVCVHSVVTRRERIHPGGQQGCSSESTEEVRPLIVIDEIISELPTVVNLFFLQF